MFLPFLVCPCCSNHEAKVCSVNSMRYSLLATIFGIFRKGLPCSRSMFHLWFAFSSSTKAQSSLRPLSEMLVAQAMPTDPVPIMEILLGPKASSEVKFFVSSYVTVTTLDTGVMSQGPRVGYRQAGGTQVIPRHRNFTPWHPLSAGPQKR